MKTTKFKYSILTFIFNDYDSVRTPIETDGDVEYVLVSDKPIEHPIWKVIVDPNLADKDPIYQSYYVRYHPYEYVSSDIVVVIDASIKILKNIDPIVVPFIESDNEIMLMGSYYLTIDQKVEHWLKFRNLHSIYVDGIEKIKKEFNAEKLVGSIMNTFKICKHTQTVENFHNMTWEYLLACGPEGISPNRLDEIVEHIVLTAFFSDMSYSVVALQVIHSEYMQQYYHKTCLETKLPIDYDDYYYIANKAITPLRFGNERHYPKKYLYKTEVMLLTKYIKAKDLDDWLDWHLNKCGIEHIQIFANDLCFNIQKECTKYDENRVSITYISGPVRQYKIYNEYVSNRCEAEWVMPIDDDEYLQLSPEFNNFYEAIMYYQKKIPHLEMLGIRWKHMFPKSFRKERTGSVLDYCTEENACLAVTFYKGGDRCIKTVVHRTGKIYYEEAFENPCGGHVPKHSSTIAAKIFNGDPATMTYLTKIPDDTTDEKIRLLHCRYTGIQDWKDKYMNEDPDRNCKKISNYVTKDKAFKFNEILDYLP